MTGQPQQNHDEEVDIPVRHLAAPIPAEGENGVFTQTWWPICLSDELEAGRVISREFLGGRVIAYRDTDGTAHVMSAYCPHVGADIGIGAVIGDNVQCPFHHWQFNSAGQCVKTAIGDHPPRTARLFKFPTIERLGLVMAFNGVKPLFDFPDFFEKPEADLNLSTFRAAVMDCDGWVFAANTPDMQHLKVLHGVTFGHDDPHKLVRWHEWGFDYNFAGGTGEGNQKGEAELAWRLGIHGSNIFFQEGTHNGRWYGGFAIFSCIRPNKSEIFGGIVTARSKDDGNAAGLALLKEMMAFEGKVVNEDLAVLNTIKYRPGTLTKSDKTLGRFLDYLRTYPRAHPSAPFIH
ncbi:Rieske (2Fe-2S) domain protein [Rhizorhabdus wittichii RW1]|uniref:Rieske (2Fe-2S) domain protein n=2 Tax=Rhizorhabdus wittichii TaxID=160791 RepID=A0A9J9LCM4_RHIWR|nr:Rieske 2Fe-2S domain-containing protein [Rhizorhabdus wittichii]ABQ67204.1 Rieske (2Fe-2S) domain protein [Rhizorhabdus wittichii RW1]QTH23203.1 Rieske 2Fe-2S domain-containing protein [Rhizorhabdus wittichii]